ncbi:hypothetical protein B7494_g5325 [Chlorociboria aeruginascens]|nr:hypothetical protein B7494_g5325 [Chlorociboria aeruginascens]
MTWSNLNTLFLASSFTAFSPAIASPGCGLDLPASQIPGGLSQNASITSSGVNRTYLVHIPSNYDINTPVPLIFSFHGGGKNASEQEELSQFSNDEFNPDAIAVYPQGIGATWQGIPNVTTNDTGFVSDMMDLFNDIYCIDTTRYYAAGKSDGGGFTGTLACDYTLSTKIAAFAPVSGAFYIQNTTECVGTVPQTIVIPCNPGRNPLPIIEFHGSADKVIKYAGGARKKECLPTIPHWVREWSKREGFGLTNLTTALFDNHVQEYQYGGAFGELGIVTHYLTDGLGHAWPSTLPNDDNSLGTFYNATPIIMDFFNKHPL